jgi:hypothetical protein
LNNLNRPRPEAWCKGSLFSFIEECWSNSVAVVANKNIIANRLSAIDQIFEDTHLHLKPSSMVQVVPALLMLRSFSNFRAASMVCLSLPTDSYPLQRACLESAGYANLIATQAELSALWLKRDEDPQAKSRFTNRAVREAIETHGQLLGAIYQDLYERTIDFGAHPNEKSVVANIVKGSVDTGNIQVRMLAGDDVMLDLGLRTCAQVGICSLKVLNLVFGPQFAAQGFEEKIAKVSLPF